MRIISAVIIFCLIGCQSEKGPEIRSVMYTTGEDLTAVGFKEDTVFIVKEEINGNLHTVFIDENRNSQFRNRLLNFEVPKYHKDSFKESLQFLDSNCSRPVAPFSNNKLPKQLLPLHAFEGNWYLYAPSDWGAAGRRILTDTTYVVWQMDGLYPYPIVSRKEIAPDRIELTIEYCGQLNDRLEVIIINLGDTDKGLYKFEFPSRSESQRYEWYTSIEKASCFDLIVNYSNNSKWIEYQFDNSLE